MTLLTNLAFGDYPSVAVPAQVSCFPEGMWAVAACGSESGDEFKERS